MDPINVLHIAVEIMEFAGWIAVCAFVVYTIAKGK
jgi:hypothetical protein